MIPPQQGGPQCQGNTHCGKEQGRGVKSWRETVPETKQAAGGGGRAGRCSRPDAWK